MMRLVAVATILLSPIDANRVKHHTDSRAINSKSGAQFSEENCTRLHTIFHTRVANIQTLQAAHPDESSFSLMTQARVTMKTFGVIRILRRAKECDWVVDSDRDDMDHVRAVAHSALAINPCGGAALLALSAPGSPEKELLPLQNAVQILFSDNCVAPSEGMAPTEVFDPEDGDATNQLMNAEDETQDRIDELMDAAETENERLAAGSFIQTEASFRTVSKLLGAVFLTILYLLSCATVGALIVMLITYVTLALPCMMSAGSGGLGCLMFPLVGLAIGGAAGFVSCGVDVVRRPGQYLPAWP